MHTARLDDTRGRELGRAHIFIMFLTRTHTHTHTRTNTHRHTHTRNAHKEHTRRKTGRTPHKSLEADDALTPARLEGGVGGGERERVFLFPIYCAFHLLHRERERERERERNT